MRAIELAAGASSSKNLIVRALRPMFASPTTFVFQLFFYALGTISCLLIEGGVNGK